METQGQPIDNRLKKRLEDPSTSSSKIAYFEVEASTVDN